MSKLLRVCTVCSIEKPANGLNFPANGRGGLRGECKACWRFKNMALHANYRAKKLGHAERLTVEDIRAAYAQAAGCCYWTQAPLGYRWVIDHIVPLSGGGLNSPNNICVTTARINGRKSSKRLRIWLSELASMGYEHELQEGLGLPIQRRLGI